MICEKRRWKPRKFGLPPKWISCSSRPSATVPVESSSLNKILLPVFFRKTGGISLLSLLHLNIIATMALPIIDRKKEAKRIKSTTDDGVFCFTPRPFTFSLGLRGFFSFGTKIWLRIRRNTKNRIDAISATVAVSSRVPSPWVVWFTVFGLK